MFLICDLGTFSNALATFKFLAARQLSSTSSQIILAAFSASYMACVGLYWLGMWKTTVNTNSKTSPSYATFINPKNWPWKIETIPTTTAFSKRWCEKPRWPIKSWVVPQESETTLRSAHEWQTSQNHQFSRYLEFLGLYILLKINIHHILYK